MSKLGSADVDIKYEDQRQINEFSKGFQKTKELAAELAKLEESRKRLEDCVEELELSTEDEVDFQFADCFVKTSVDTAKDMTEKRLKDIQKEIEQKSLLRSAIRKQLDSLKAELYAKFGNNINLEE